MKRIPRPVLRALEALAQSPINTSALAISPTTPSTGPWANPWPSSLSSPWSSAETSAAWNGATSSLMTSPSSATVRAG